jgi:hypothetical protein
VRISAKKRKSRKIASPPEFGKFVNNGFLYAHVLWDDEEAVRF